MYGLWCFSRSRAVQLFKVYQRLLHSCAITLSDIMLCRSGYGTKVQVLEYKIRLVFPCKNYLDKKIILRDIIEYYQDGLEMIIVKCPTSVEEMNSCLLLWSWAIFTSWASFWSGVKPKVHFLMIKKVLSTSSYIQRVAVLNSGMIKLSMVKKGILPWGRIMF